MTAQINQKIYYSTILKGRPCLEAYAKRHREGMTGGTPARSSKMTGC